MTTTDKERILNDAWSKANNVGDRANMSELMDASDRYILHKVLTSNCLSCNFTVGGRMVMEARLNDMIEKMEQEDEKCETQRLQLESLPSSLA